MTWLRIDEFEMPSADDANNVLGFPRDIPGSLAAVGLTRLTTECSEGPQPLKFHDLVDYLKNKITENFGNKPTWRFIEVEFTYELFGGESPVGYMVVPLVRGFIKRLHRLVIQLIYEFEMRVIGKCVCLRHQSDVIIDASRVRGSINILRINVYRTMKKLRKRRLAAKRGR